MWQVWEFVQEMTRREALPRPGDDLVVMGGPPCQVGQTRHLLQNSCMKNIINAGIQESSGGMHVHDMQRVCMVTCRPACTVLVNASKRPGQDVRCYRPELRLICC